MIGKVLSNRYEIVARLGSGGMAHVYKANCKYLHRPVSVKVLRSEHAQDEEFLRRFEREAQAAASLSHPNIQGVYDVGTEGDIHYIVMEYVKGETLKELIKREGQLPIPKALDITMQILRALEHAHENGVIHRDIKPHNILITPEGHVKVSDFGLARATSTATLVHSGAVVGSAHYFSPEQARGGYTNERSDLYSVGVVLYEMITGRVPFEGETPVAVALKHLQEPVTPPSELNENVSPDLEAVILKALAKKQADRYQSARDMLQDILALQRNDPVSVHRESLSETRVMQSIRPHDTKGTAGPNGKPERPALRRGRHKTTGSPPRRLKPWIRRSLWALFFLALVAGAVFAAYQIANWFNVPIVTVPDVRGKEVGEAEDMLRNAGLDPKITGSEFSDDVPVGHVILQTPEADSTVKRGRTIELVQSSGPEWVEGGVPKVVGLSKRAAAIELQEVGLKWEYVEAYSADVAKDYIVEQNPRATTPVQKNTVVQLTVSLGREPVALTAPNLVGMPLSDALSTLQDLGLERGEVSRSKGIYPADYILAQDPAAGATVQTGDSVNMTVSQGCANTDSITVNTQRAESTNPRLQVTLVDAVSERTVYDETVSRGTTVSVPLCWAGQNARVVVLFDGVEVAEQALSAR